jgi:hypothetical protein
MAKQAAESFAARSPGRVALVFAAAWACAAALLAGCSRHEDEEGDAVAEDGGTAARTVLDAARPVDAADAAPARDARADDERAALTDAGRFCGEKDLPDCPLQLWMRRNATPMIRFGETTALAEVFDQIATLSPAGHALARDTYPNWVSIARDGAAAARVADIPAAKAACRGCHTQYRARYHADLRALPVSVLPPVALKPQPLPQPP